MNANMCYWVIIYRDKIGGICACVSNELFNFLKRDEDGRDVLYIRLFSHSTAAKAYKNLVEDLTESALWQIINERREISQIILKRYEK